MEKKNNKEKAKQIAKDVGKDLGRGVKGFLKAKVLMFFITFIILVVGIAISGTTWWLVAPVALLIAFVDLLPVLGCGVVLVPWAIVALICDNEYMCIVLAITYLVLLVGRQIIEPKLLGDSIGVRPLVTFLFTVVGTWAIGPAGLIVGPLVAVILTSIIRLIKGSKDPRD